MFPFDLEYTVCTVIDYWWSNFSKNAPIVSRMNWVTDKCRNTLKRKLLRTVLASKKKQKLHCKHILKNCVHHTSLTGNTILLSRCINYSARPFMLGCTQRLSCFSSQANSKQWRWVGDLLDRLVFLCAHTHSDTGLYFMYLCARDLYYPH